MQREDDESKKEYEPYCEHEFERQENDPVEILERQLHKFWHKPTDIGAKYLWLQYTKAKEDVPNEVMEWMIRIIEDDIERYQDDGKNKRTLPGMMSEKEINEPIFDLLHCAMVDPDRFWRTLYPSPGDAFFFNFCPASVLEATRLEFPHKKKLSPGVLYNFFGKQIGLPVEENGSDIGERMRSRYKTYKKNIERKGKLLDMFRLPEE